MLPPETKLPPLAIPVCRDEATSALQKPVTSLWGVGAERAAQLARLDLHTIEDLLLHRPRRYEDRRHFRAIAELTRDEAATARGTIVALQALSRRRQIGL
jgi:ATP-dependent DNA helicase RecG